MVGTLPVFWPQDLAQPLGFTAQTEMRRDEQRSSVHKLGMSFGKEIYGNHPG